MMWRSVRVELSTCHKVHLPPQISLSCNFIPRQLLGKCQRHIRFFSAGPFQELCTVDCALPPYSEYCFHIYPHQVTFYLFICTKLLLSQNMYYHYTIGSNTTIITQNTQILLLMMMMMISFITIKSSLVPLIEGLCAQI